MTRPLSIVLSAREVVAAGEPFRPWGEAFADVGVALDEISSLRAAQEPVVLRVAASGGSKAERASVMGDWLCDVGMEPRRVSDKRWSHSANAAAWSSKLPLLDAWERCDSVEWMVYEADERRVPSRRVAAAAAELVRSVAPSLGEARAAVSRVIDAVRQWSDGAADGPRPPGDRLRSDGETNAGRSAIVAAELLRNHYNSRGLAHLVAWNAEWARWAACRAGHDWACSLDLPSVVRREVTALEVLRASSA